MKIAAAVFAFAAGCAIAAEPAPNKALAALFDREFKRGLDEHPEQATFLGIPGYDAQFSQWTGLFVPAGTPDAVVAKLREAAKFAVDDANFKAALAKVETPVQYLDQPQFRAFWDADASKLANVVKRIGKVE